MIQYDIAEIIRAEEERLMESPEGAFFCTHFSDNLQEALEGVTINSVWKNCIDRIGNSSNDETMSLAAERLIIGLIHKGVSKDKIRIRHSHFTVSLNNRDYLILKRAEGIVIKPIKCAEFKGVVVSADANLLSGLLLAFDAAIPEMRQVAERLLIHYRKEELEHEIKSIISEARNKRIDSIIEEYLHPLGIEVWYVFDNDDNTVDVDLTRDDYIGHCVIPQEEFERKLKDIEYIQGLLKLSPFKKTDNSELLTIR